MAQICPRWNRLEHWFELAEAFRSAASTARFQPRRLMIAAVRRWLQTVLGSALSAGSGLRSEHVQVVTGHKTASISRSHLPHQIVLGRLSELILLVVEDQETRTRSRRQLTELAR